jgi:hypothetical protein
MNRKIYHYLLASACLVVLSAGKIKAQAQPDYLHCTTDNAMDELFRNHPDARAQYEELTRNSIQNLQQFKLQNPVLPQGGPPQFIIPVVFHIIHQYGSEDISDAQVQDEIDVLNIDYRLKNPDTANASQPFKSLYADAKIEFRLATKDPNGNCTNGIEHIYSHLTNQGGDDSKLNPWPRNRYLNIWIVKSIGAQGAAGYAYYPSAVVYFSPLTVLSCFRTMWAALGQETFSLPVLFLTSWVTTLTSSIPGEITIMPVWPVVMTELPTLLLLKDGLPVPRFSLPFI